MVQLPFDENAVKKATNLSINLSSALEHTPENALRKAERTKWRKDNRKAIEALNELADGNGLFSDAWRCF